MSDIYLSLSETPTVVTLSQPVVSGALASTVTVANTVTVALDANSLSALEQVTVTVGAAVSVSNFPATQVVSVSNLPATQPVSLASLPGSTVTVANFPATQTIVGTVTVGALPSVNIGTAPVFSTMLVDDEANGLGFGQYPVLASLSSNNLAAVTIGVRGTVTANTGLSQPLTDAQLRAAAVTVALDSASLNALENVTVTVGAAVTIAGFSTSSLPPSTVTVGNSVTINGTVTARLQDGSGNNLTSTSIGGVQRLNVSLASAATPGGSIPTFVNVYGGSDSGTVRAVAVDSSGRSVVTVSNFPATQAVSLASTTVTVSSLPALAAGTNQIGSVTASISGTVSVSISSVTIGNAVTVSALPSGSLTTRFGSVTTANTAQITSAVTNTSRKYLLAQNISAGTVTIGIGFSPTTTQGIQLSAGGGLTFDAFCPTGAVYWLGAVTGAAFTILEG